jgi:hypothetical protein
MPRKLNPQGGTDGYFSYLVTGLVVSYINGDSVLNTTPNKAWTVIIVKCNPAINGYPTIDPVDSMHPVRHLH